jgi:uncharacterized membrane protein
MLWLPIIFLKNYNHGKDIMSTLGHLEIKTSSHARITFFEEKQNICSFSFSHYVKQNIVWILFYEGNWKWGQKCKMKHFNHTLSKNCKGKRFFTSRNARFFNFCVFSITLLERVFEDKKLEMNEVDIYPFFNMLVF